MSGTVLADFERISFAMADMVEEEDPTRFSEGRGEDQGEGEEGQVERQSDSATKGTTICLHDPVKGGDCQTAWPPHHVATKSFWRSFLLFIPSLPHTTHPPSMSLPNGDLDPLCRMDTSSTSQQGRIPFALKHSSPASLRAPEPENSPAPSVKKTITSTNTLSSFVLL